MNHTILTSPPSNSNPNSTVSPTSSVPNHSHENSLENPSVLGEKHKQLVERKTPPTTSRLTKKNSRVD